MRAPHFLTGLALVCVAVPPAGQGQGRAASAANYLFAAS